MASGFDLRKLRYFVAVAEAGNFTRAAVSLHIAQPVLSRQIKELERELGGPLFVRHPRRLELTPAGRKLLTDGRRLLTSATRLTDDVRGIATGTRSLTVGHHRAIALRQTVLAFQHKHSGIDVTVVPLDHDSETHAVLSGAVDVAVVCPSSPPADVASTVLWQEPTMAALSTGHELAQRPTLTLADLAPFNRARFDSTRPDGRALRDADDRLDLLANSSAVHLAPALAARRYHHPDVTFIPVTDAPPTPILAVWDNDRQSRLIVDFTAAALEVHNATTSNN
ncbi:LysR family transcriptional regulator [Nocardia africana]|uniref:Hca operon transcriptional activator n=1 Tax=Nocardia africana TaxID=134964 RepID=A0A378WUJ2_9NOCA|nr:LysR family transcriptional regulator [Nocardia africana]MCC3313693.1 LysR family transcriptional regulator [Nocardia africana]SUA44926.1 Hca operon transcriptional activator [Nocardia africana]